MFQLSQASPISMYSRKLSDTLIYELTPPLTPIESKPNLQYGNTSFERCDLSNPVTAVIGVGYVGFHLVEQFGGQYPTIAFDISNARLEQVRTTLSAAASENTCLTSNKSELSRATHFLVSVPTTLHADNSINTTYLTAALETIGEYARPGAVVVIESSVAVGMTRNLLKTLVEEKGVLGGMSPERVDPGRVQPSLYEVPKIISGLNEESLLQIEKLYTPCFQNIVKVSSCEVAEMVKLYENCQRMVNIAYANEMADAAYSIGLDPYEVAEAAATKPFGYMPFSPSLGVGGHCIPCNPYYLSSNLSFPLLQMATETTAKRPSKVADTLTPFGMKNASVLVVGLGFKRGESVLSHSPGISFANRCVELGAKVQWYDPVVSAKNSAQVNGLDEYKGSWLARELMSQFDHIVVAVNQANVDWSVIKTVESLGQTKVDWRIRRPE